MNGRASNYFANNAFSTEKHLSSISKSEFFSLIIIITTLKDTRESQRHLRTALLSQSWPSDKNVTYSSRESHPIWQNQALLSSTSIYILNMKGNNTFSRGIWIPDYTYLYILKFTRRAMDGHIFIAHYTYIYIYQHSIKIVSLYLHHRKVY